MNDSQDTHLKLSEHSSPQAALVKAILAEPGCAEAIIRDQMPSEMLAMMCNEPPILMEGSYIDAELRDDQTDALYQIKLRPGGIAFVFVLFEHRDKPDPYTPLHLLKCQVRIWEAYADGNPEKLQSLPPIIPLLIYHGVEPWDIPQTIGGLLDGRDPMRSFAFSSRYR